MTAAAKLTIFDRIEAQQYLGYVLWAVWRRTRARQFWADSVKVYGRTDIGALPCYTIPIRAAMENAL